MFASDGGQPSSSRNARRDLAVMLAVSLAVFTSFLAMLGSAPHTWRLRGVVTLWNLPFADLGNILAGARCATQGMDVLVQNPCDPLHRAMNYPRVWLVIARALGATSPIVPGITLAGLFYVSAAFLPRMATPSRVLLWLLALSSPAVTLAVERGNNDLVVFVLSLPALALLRKGALARHAAGGLLLLVSVLKLFPGIGLLLLPRKSALGRVGWSYPALFIVYLAITYRDVLAIVARVPHEVLMSFGGATTIAMFMDLLFGVRVGGEVLLPLGCVLAVGLVGFGILWGRRGPTREREDVEARPHLAYAVLLFVASFSLGSSYDYRLVVLLLALPTALDAATGAIGPGVCRLGRWVALLILLSLWSGGRFPGLPSFLGKALLLLDMAATPMLVFALVALAIRLYLPAPRVDLR